MTDLPERELRGLGIIGETVTPRIRRVFYDYRDFQMRLDTSSPAHYDVELVSRDSKRRIWIQTYKIYGADRRGNLLIFERKWIHSTSLAGLRQAMVDSFIANYARPLNAVPGRLEVSGKTAATDIVEAVR